MSNILLKKILRKLKKIVRGNCGTELTYLEKTQKLPVKYPSRIYFGQDGNDMLLRHVINNEAFFVSRFGGVELGAVNFYLQKRLRKDKESYDEKIRQTLFNNAGFFPVDDAAIDTFCCLYLDSIKDITALAVWFNDNEWNVTKKNCKHALLVELESLTSFLYSSPYTQILKNKKILVIHPFIETIRSQYDTRRKELFRDPSVLPDFTLSLLKSPQTIAGNTDGYSCWMDAYNDMCTKIDNFDFDIAIIGAGAYGLPLGSYIKRKGKSVLHLGGATQLLFGIKGKRWETEYDFASRIFNEYWVYPSENEKPLNFKKVENGCYW